MNLFRQSAGFDLLSDDNQNDEQNKAADQKCV